MTENTSEHYRIKGNELYRLCYEGLPKFLYMDRLNGAINNYELGLKAASPIEQASFYKNLGKAYGKYSQVIDETNKLLYFFQECFKNLNLAFTNYSQKPDEWKEDLINYSFSLVEILKDFFGSYSNRKERIDAHFSLLKHCPDLKKLKFHIQMSLCENMLNQGIVELEAGQWKRALQSLNALAQPLNETIMACEDPNTKVILDDYLERKEFHILRAEGVKLKSFADDLFHQLNDVEETVILDLVWDAIDAYRVAMRNCGDIEMEAIINEKVGQLFYVYLSLKERAYMYFHQCIILANSLIPRNLSDRAWYKAAAEKMLEKQTKVSKDEQDKYEKLKELFLTELKADIEEARVKSNISTQALIDYLLGKYPPEKLFDKKLGMKKQLQNLLLIFHPDKHMTSDTKKYVLMTELTKFLTYHYERYK